MYESYFPDKVANFLLILDDSNFRKHFPGIPEENAKDLIRSFKNILIFYHHGYIYDEHFSEDEEAILTPLKGWARFLPDDEGEITSYVLLHSIHEFSKEMKAGLFTGNYDADEIYRHLIIFERCILEISNRGNLLKI